MGTDSKAETLFDLTGRTALVTGASSGLGARFATTLAANGARVVLAARRTDRLLDLKESIEKAGGEAAVVALDVADRAQIAPAFDEAERHFGTVTILVNNAGIAVTGRVLELDPDDWRRLMAVNLDGVWFTGQEAARRMVKANVGGSIINIASILGSRVSRGLAAYAASKGAVVQVTRAMALELARHDIRVNAIAPGYVLTEMNQEFFESDAGAEFIKRIPQRRIADPGEFDGVLLLLASNASSFMTGSIVTVDGGQTLED